MQLFVFLFFDYFICVIVYEKAKETKEQMITNSTVDTTIFTQYGDDILYCEKVGKTSGECNTSRTAQL